jgi:hypothetical protein
MSLTAPERVYAQYRDKPKTYQWYGITQSISNDIQSAADDVRLMYDIDNNEGEQLDIIGRIVGVDRRVITGITTVVSEFGDTAAECGDVEVQFGNDTITEEDSLSDDYFRSLIKAKVQNNNNDTTIDGVIESINAIISGDVSVIVNDNEDMTFSVEIYGIMTEIETYLILNNNIIPKPQGVRITGYLLASAAMSCGDGVSCGDPEAECSGFISI